MIQTYQDFNQFMQDAGCEIRILYSKDAMLYCIHKSNHSYLARDAIRKAKWKWDSDLGWNCSERLLAQDPNNLHDLAHSILLKLKLKLKLKPKGDQEMPTPKNLEGIKDKISKYNLTAKDKAYMAWYEDPNISSEELSEMVGGDASVTKINSWRGGWAKNERIPQKAAWAIIEELEHQIEQMEEGDSPQQARKIQDLQALVKRLTESSEALSNLNDSLTEQVKELEKRKPAPKNIILHMPDKKKRILKDKRHPAYEEVITLASMRKNIFLPGPAGCGKSHLCQQVAKDLKLDFSFINCSVGMSEGHLLGRLLPVGEQGQFQYVTAEYVERYEKGGMFCADELDASDPNVLLVINTSISNGYMMLPNRPQSPRVERHPDFVFIGCANTYGRGSDRLYVGRNQLDEATLDRFRIGTVPMDYNSGENAEEFSYTAPQIPNTFKTQALKWEGIEKDLCPDDDLRVRLQWYRKKVNDNKLERIVSTRFMIDAFDMKSKAEWSDARIDKALFSGWSADERVLVLGN